MPLGTCNMNALVGACLPLLVGLAAAQQPREEVAPYSSPDLERLQKSEWTCIYELLAPKLTKDELIEIADALHSARTAAAEHAVSWLVREEEGLRASAGPSGRAEIRYAETYTLRVRDDGRFYQRRDRDGGWQPTATQGRTEQVLVLSDLVISRADDSQKAVASPLYVDSRSTSDKIEATLMVDAWSEHTAILIYCSTYGEDRGRGRRVVEREAFLRRPPSGVVCPPVGLSLASIASTSGTGTEYVVSMFDHAGRVCKEWKSTWANRTPRKLATREFFSAGRYLDRERQLTIMARDDGRPFPEIADIVATPFERRFAKDARIAGEPEVDLLRGVASNTEAQALSNKIDSDMARPQLAPDKAQENIAAWNRDRRPPAESIPTSPHYERQSTARVTIVVVACVVVGAAIGFVLWRRRSSHTALLFAIVVWNSCGQPTTVATHSAVLAKAGGIDVVPRVIALPAPRNRGEIRSAEIYVSNLSDEKIKIISALPSCGCVDLEPVGLDRSSPELGAWESASFRVFVEMDRFHAPLEVMLSWSAPSGTVGSSKVRLTN